ncbi:hypothetical protein [Candidatus Nitrospira salsa]
MRRPVVVGPHAQERYWSWSDETCGTAWGTTNQNRYRKILTFTILRRIERALS